MKIQEGSVNTCGEFVVNGINQGHVNNKDDGDYEDDVTNDDDGNDDNGGNDRINKNGDERNAEITNGATKNKIKCRLANASGLCFVNIRTKGRELMEKANPYIT